MYVRIWMDKGSLYCCVRDNGKGFSEAAARPQADTGSGFGLMSVCDQMEHLGGSADIDSVPGQGTAVTLKLPLVKENTAHD
ncbi:sensory histidine kinase DcuS [compost metagenome]